MDYLNLNDMLAVRDQVGESQAARIEIMSANGLMSALAAPRQSAFGVEAFPTMPEKAAALVYSLVQNHPFRDGNKRIAAAALRLFVERNGAQLQADQQQIKRFTADIVSGALRDGELVAWLRAHIQDDQAGEPKNSET